MSNKIKDSYVPVQGFSYQALADDITPGGFDIGDGDNEYITKLMDDLGLPSSYRKYFDDYDTTDEHYMLTSSAMQFDTLNLQANKHLYDFREALDEMKRQQKFANVGAHDSKYGIDRIFKQRDYGKSKLFLDTKKGIYDARRRYMEESMAMGADLAMYQEDY